MLIEISQAVSSVKAITDIIGLMSKVKTDSAVVQKAIELQSTIITLQSAMMTIQSEYQSLLAEKDDLKKQLMDVENWGSEAAKYQLTEIPPGIFVYAVKPDQNGTDLNHWLCANCYNKRQKSILQNTGRVREGYNYVCPNCSTHFPSHKIPNATPKQPEIA